MKKIVWVFGESATGKLTLINNLYNNDINTINSFNMENKKIMVSEITLEDRNPSYENFIDNNIYDDSLLEEDGPYFNKEKELDRRSKIMYDVDKFLSSDNDILLIKGQVNDMNIKRGNIIGNFLNKYGCIDNLYIEVFILQVTNENELRRRIETKPWFKAMQDDLRKQKLLSVIPIKQEKHKQDVIESFKGYNVSINIIESLNNSYRKDGVINGKSSNFRR